MSISPISAALPVSPSQSTQAPQTPAPVQKQDSVHLSAAAKSASGDADHDGD